MTGKGGVAVFVGKRWRCCLCRKKVALLSWPEKGGAAVCAKKRVALPYCSGISGVSVFLGSRHYRLNERLIYVSVGDHERSSGQWSVGVGEGAGTMGMTALPPLSIVTVPEPVNNTVECCVRQWNKKARRLARVLLLLSIAGLSNLCLAHLQKF